MVLRELVCYLLVEMVLVVMGMALLLMEQQTPQGIDVPLVFSSFLMQLCGFKRISLLHSDDKRCDTI